MRLLWRRGPQRRQLRPCRSASAGAQGRSCWLRRAPGYCTTLCAAQKSERVDRGKCAACKKSPQRFLATSMACLRAFKTGLRHIKSTFKHCLVHGSHAPALRQALTAPQLHWKRANASVTLRCRLLLLHTPVVANTLRADEAVLAPRTPAPPTPAAPECAAPEPRLALDGSAAHQATAQRYAQLERSERVEGGQVRRLQENATAFCCDLDGVPTRL